VVVYLTLKLLLYDCFRNFVSCVIYVVHNRRWPLILFNFIYAANLNVFGFIFLTNMFLPLCINCNYDSV
jgi:hypothetical protein